MDDAKLDLLIELLLAREKRDAQEREYVPRPVASQPRPAPRDVLRTEQRGTRGLLQRLGWNRKDVSAVELATAGQVVASVGDYSLHLADPGNRTQAISVNVPAAVGAYGMAYLTPPLVGAWLIGICNGGSRATWGTEALAGSSLPALTPAGGTALLTTFQPDPREAILLVGTETGSSAAGWESYHMLPPDVMTFFPHPFWWRGQPEPNNPLAPTRNRLVFQTWAQNTELQITLYYRGALNDLEAAHSS